VRKIKVLGLISFLMVCVLMFGGMPLVYANQPTRLLVNGRPHHYPELILVGGNPLMPARQVANLFGGRFIWGPHYSQALLVINDNIYIMSVDSVLITLNEGRLQANAPAQIINHQVFLPLCFVADVEGWDIRIAEDTNTVHLANNHTRAATYAGMGIHGNADGVNAQFNLPNGVFGGNGYIFVADTFNNLIRKICYDGVTDLYAGRILAVDDRGFPHGFIRDGDRLEDALFNRPMDGVVGECGRIFVADAGNHAIRVIDGDNVLTLTGGTAYGHADGGVSEALFNFPVAIAMDEGGNLFVADTLNHAIRKITANGQVYTIAGVAGEYGFEDGDAENAMFNTPMGIAVDENGRIFVADTGNHLIRVIDGGKVYTIAGTLTFDADREWDGVPMGGFADGVQAMFNQPTGIALWGDVLIVADTANHSIRNINIQTGVVFTIAGNGYPGRDDGVPVDATFHLPAGVFVVGDTIFVADTGNNLIRTITLR